MKKDVAKLIEQGYQVVPLQPNSKACKNDNWLEKTFTVEDFEENDNIGIRSVEGIVVIDEDAPEVVRLADKFLPKTNAIYGRNSKPKSKRIYRSTFGRMIAYKDAGITLIEIRVEHQDMAPPSIHPDGEVLKWVKNGKPSEVDHETLMRSVQLCATCAIIARNYNEPGARHDWTLALSGELRRLMIIEIEAIKIIKNAAIVAGDKKLEDRLTEVKSTYSRSEDEPIVSGKALDNEQFLRNLRKIWGAEGVSQSKIKELNKRHSLIFQQSGQLVVVTQDMYDGRPLIRFSPLDVMSKLYPQMVSVGQRDNGSPILKRLGSAWLEHPDRAFFNGIELNPGVTTDGFYNLWKGFTVEPKPGDWKLFKRHVYEVICCENKSIFEYVIGWMAQAVRDPGHPADTAIALRGGQGVGKSAFVKWFGALFGPHFLHLNSQRQLTGNFNAHLQNAVIVFADEAAWPGDRAGIGALRRMVTEDTLTIERKGADIYTVKNIIHLLLASNEDWVVPATFDERRFVVLDVSDRYQNQRKEWFMPIARQLFDQGGMSAMLFDLLEHETKVDLRVIPQTKALWEQKKASASPMNKWWLEKLVDETFWPEKKDVEVAIARQVVYDDYIELMKQVGARNFRAVQSEIGVHLSKMLKKGYPKSARKGRSRLWVFPSLEDCRETFEKRFRVEIQWPTDKDLEGGEKLKF